MKELKSIITLLLLGSCFILKAEDVLKYENYVYEKNIKTVLLRQVNSDNNLAIMSLGQTNALEIKFDEMGATEDYYHFTFVHCTHDWKPSNLQKQNYIDGELFGTVPNGQSSTNTFQSYIHYGFTFPNEDMPLTLSGNYLLKVYRDFNEADLVLTMRFMVIDERVKLNGEVKRATISKYRRTHQEVDFTVEHPTYTMPNPFMDTKVVILQNNRWDNAIYGLKPLFSAADKLTYNYENENLFLGGNEFRSFDMRSLRFLSNNVKKKFISKSNRKHVVLYPEVMKGNLAYLQFKDFNGTNIIDNRDGITPSIDGDYAKVHFTLLSTEKLKEPVYLTGEFNFWKPDSNYLMNYNNLLNAYELSVPLKQGYYNYHYTTLSEGVFSVEKTEGNNFETGNQYQILFYHKNQALQYDELVGTRFLTTLPETSNR